MPIKNEAAAGQPDDESKRTDYTGNMIEPIQEARDNGGCHQGTEQQTSAVKYNRQPQTAAQAGQPFDQLLGLKTQLGSQ